MMCSAHEQVRLLGRYFGPAATGTSSSNPRAIAFVYTGPLRRRSAEQRHELAPTDHSITSSARAISLSGTVRPSALAVLRLITSSNFDGCSTGRSLGLSVESG